MKIKVLHIVTRLDIGGISSLLYGYFKYIDRSKVHFDVVTIETDYVQDCQEAFRNLGVNVYFMPKRVFRRLGFLTTLFKRNNYDYVHSHVELPSAIYLALAKYVGIKGRIAHGHLAIENNGVKNKLFTLLLNNVVTTRIGASDLAVESLFGKSYSRKAIILKNAIDVDKYIFNIDMRRKYRHDLGIEAKFVVGFVGRLTYLKNIFYLLDVFKALNKKIPNAYLLIVGDGELKDSFYRKVIEDELQDHVKILGNREDVNLLMMAMDVNLLTSFKEGLGMVLIEAQAASLKSIANSSGIPKMAKVSPYLLFEDIHDSPAIWVDRIISECLSYHRGNTHNYVSESHFNVRKVANNLLDIYKCRKN